MPRSALAGDPSDVFRVLLGGGLFIAPSRKDRERLVEYFTLCNPSVRARCVDRAGWCPENGGPRYVLPGGAAIGPITGEEVVLLPEGSPRSRRVAKIAKPTGSKLVKGPAESGEICSVEVEEK
jgi:hypothetical protein